MNIQRIGLVAFCVFMMPFASHAIQGAQAPRLAISQGISTPNITSPVNLSHGFVPTNPAVAGSLSGFHLSAEYGFTDENKTKSSTLGVEAGAGNGTVGLGVGYRKADCNNCEGRAAGIAGVTTDSFAFGLGFGQDKDYSLGLVLNPNGEHRVGLVANMYDSDVVDGDLQSYGVGYSYHGDSFILAIDASKRQHTTSRASDDVILITPGLQIKVDWLSLMVSHDLHTNNEAKTFEDNTWFGIGIGDTDKHLAIYHDYYHQWSLAGTLWF